MHAAGTPPRRLLVVWWSNTGGTAQLVEAVVDGALRAVAGSGARFDAVDCRCDRVAPPALQAADALLFATPECLGSVAGPMKTFFDRCYYPLLGRIEGRPYATLVCAGSDGHGAVRQIERIATGWRLRQVVEPLRAITGAQTPSAILAAKSIPSADRSRAAELGATLALGTQLGIW